MATVPTTLIEPIRVANLPLPPDLAAMLEQHWRSCGYTARERAAVEDDFKLRYHYAGHIIEATADPPDRELPRFRLPEGGDDGHACHSISG